MMNIAQQGVKVLTDALTIPARGMEGYIGKVHEISLFRKMEPDEFTKLNAKTNLFEKATGLARDVLLVGSPFVGLTKLGALIGAHSIEPVADAAGDAVTGGLLGVVSGYPFKALVTETEKFFAKHITNAGNKVQDGLYGIFRIPPTEKMLERQYAKVAQYGAELTHEVMHGKG